MFFPHRRLLVMGLLLAVLGTTASTAIVVRHDRDEAAYRELGARFPAVARILPDGTGVLVAPRFVLTAAHVARGVSARSPRVEIGGRDYPVDRIFTHPRWTDGGPHDVALLRLAKPVAGVEPVELYGASDEVGQTVTFVGFGDFGDGLTGPRKKDDRLRGATNRVEDADPDWLYFTFDPPESATELEGVSGPGDSGGPALVVRDGIVYTLGVSVFGDGPDGPGRYGVREGYTRVSTNRDWIESVLAGRSDDAGTAPGTRRQGPEGGGAVVRGVGGPAALPDTARGRQVAAYLGAYNSGDSKRMLAYQEGGFAADLLEDKTADERAAFYRRLYDELFGALTLRQVVAAEGDTLTVLFETAKGGLAEFHFELVPQPPHRITTLRIARVSLN